MGSSPTWVNDGYALADQRSGRHALNVKITGSNPAQGAEVVESGE